MALSQTIMQGKRNRRASGVQWYQTIFEVIDMRSFSNLWFWIALAVMWSMASHWVLGVPFDMVMRARKYGGEAETDLQTMVHINANRLLHIVEVSGLWLVGGAAFALTALALLGFYYQIELAQALLCLLLPMSLVGALGLRTAARIKAESPTEEALYRRLTLHRMVIQGIGMISILITSLWGMWQNLQIGVL